MPAASHWWGANLWRIPCANKGGRTIAQSSLPAVYYLCTSADRITSSPRSEDSITTITCLVEFPLFASSLVSLSASAPPQASHVRRAESRRANKVRNFQTLKHFFNIHSRFEVCENPGDISLVPEKGISCWQNCMTTLFNMRLILYFNSIIITERGVLYCQTLNFLFEIMLRFCSFYTLTDSVIFWTKEVNRTRLWLIWLAPQEFFTYIMAVSFMGGRN